jgi:general secretion pathway protein G
MLKGYGFAVAGLVLSVVAVIGWLCVTTLVIIPNFAKAANKAKNQIAKVEIQNIANALDVYSFDKGTYPTKEQGLQVLLSGKDGPYIEKLQSDPWGRPFHYRHPGKLHQDYPDIWSDGQDGIEGTEDDITN